MVEPEKSSAVGKTNEMLFCTRSSSGPRGWGTSRAVVSELRPPFEEVTSHFVPCPAHFTVVLVKRFAVVEDEHRVRHEILATFVPERF